MSDLPSSIQLADLEGIAGAHAIKSSEVEPPYRCVNVFLILRVVPGDMVIPFF